MDYQDQGNNMLVEYCLVFAWRSLLLQDACDTDNLHDFIIDHVFQYVTYFIFSTHGVESALMICKKSSVNGNSFHWFLHSKIRIISNRLDALIHCQVGINLYPLSSIMHKSEMKTPVPCILHARKLRLETRRFW